MDGSRQLRRRVGGILAFPGAESGPFVGRECIALLGCCDEIRHRHFVDGAVGQM